MPGRRPLPIQSIPEDLCGSLKMLLTDMDDTITRGGLLTAAAFSSLWKLHRRGIGVIVVTGRPAGWCDHIARMWPVAGVIGENGAFYYRYRRDRRRMKRHYLLSEAERRDGQRKLAGIRERVLREVPGCRIAADQDFRLTDLAIDFAEDVGPLSPGELDRICRIIEQEGAEYKISSIHINCWYGVFDKLRGVEEYLARELDPPSPSNHAEETIFIGDSPNDEPLFRALPHSIAVANIRPFLPKLQSLPRYITERAAAPGFSEAVTMILAKRRMSRRKAGP